MAPTKPYILIAPGSFGPAPRYALLLSSLRRAGYYGHVLYYPSFSQRISSFPSSLYDDAAHAAEELRSLVEDQGLEVLFVGHSYGGCVISEAAKEELSVARRGAEGKSGGLVGLVYLAGMVPKLGQTGDAVLTERGVKILGMLTLNETTGFLSQVHGYSEAISFSDIPYEEAFKIVELMSDHSALAFNVPLTHPGYRFHPVSYILCEKDKCIPPEVQRDLISLLEEERKIKPVIYKLDSGHCPNVSAVESLTEAIRKAAGEQL